MSKGDDIVDELYSAFCESGASIYEDARKEILDNRLYIHQLEWQLEECKNDLEIARERLGE